MLRRTVTSSGGRSAVADIYGKGAKGRATKLHGELVRARGACERCGSTQNHQCAHIVSRKFSNTRTELDNALCLCAQYHRFLTDEPYLHVAFALETRGELGYELLRTKALSGEKVDWDAEVL